MLKQIKIFIGTDLQINWITRELPNLPFSSWEAGFGLHAVGIIKKLRSLSTNFQLLLSNLKLPKFNIFKLYFRIQYRGGIEAITERNTLSSLCFNRSIEIRNEMYRQMNSKSENITFGSFMRSPNRTVSVLSPPELENCFGWRYFEYSFIISVTDSQTP